MLVISGRFEMKASSLMLCSRPNKLGRRHCRNEMFSNKFFTGDNHETYRFLDIQRSDFRYYSIGLSLVYIAVN
jgi:hypothetical protein